MEKKEVVLSNEQKLQIRISDYLESNRKGLLLGALAVALVIIAILIAVSISDSNKKEAMSRIAQYTEIYDGLKFDSEDFDAQACDKLASDLEKEISGKGYVAAKSAYLLGNIQFKKGDLQKAYDTFMRCYSIDSKSYLAPLALCDAAVVSDENGDQDKALELFIKVSADYPESAVAPKALFNTGRIYLSNGNNELAKATFDQLSATYTQSEYAKIAKNITSVM